ncbi:glucose N-acetyltransferase 1 [Alternaria alternata]|nr:glucose N-acetyltransferase 1 [Alternaria alternata]
MTEFPAIGCIHTFQVQVLRCAMDTESSRRKGSQLDSMRGGGAGGMMGIQPRSRIEAARLTVFDALYG